MAGVRRNDLARIKLVWGDPSANTPSAMSDAAMKLSQIQTPEGPVFDRQYIWHFMDVDPDEQDRMTQKFAEESFTSLLNAAEDTTEDQEEAEDESPEVPEDGRSEERRVGRGWRSREWRH